MQTLDQQSKTASLQLQLKTISEKFDLAIKNDVPLSDLKKLFHEMKELKMQLDALKSKIRPSLNPE